MAGQLRLPRDRGEIRVLMLATSGLRRHIRRNAGLRVDQADQGRGPVAALGQSLGRGPVRLELLHDHGFPYSRHPLDDRRESSYQSRAQGLARNFDRERPGSSLSRKGALRERAGRNHWSLLAFVDLVWGLHLCAFYLL